jgi:acyl-CoA thioesterase
VTLDVTLVVNGPQITQGRAVARVGDREILTVNAALGDRDFDAAGQFAKMPQAPSPEQTPARQHIHDSPGTIHDSLQQRVVKGRSLAQLDGSLSDGNVVMWAHIPALIEDVDRSGVGLGRGWQQPRQHNPHCQTCANKMGAA